MFVVRFIVLLFFVALGWGMGQTPLADLNGLGKLIAFSFFLTAPALYFLPTFEAWNKKHPNLAAIGLINAFLGWSLIGWVVAIVWAFKRPEPQVSLRYQSEPSGASVRRGRQTKSCPYCAEEVLSEAIKCKHCHSDLTATAAS